MNPPPTLSLRVAVVSIGRSGTSLVSRILHEVLGVNFGEEKDHIPRNHNNPDGYFENREFLELNEQILAAANGAVLRPPAADFMDRLSAETKSRLIDEARVKLSAYSRQIPRFGWKDPRLSLTFPIWLAAEPAVIPIVVFRNPESVLRSIADQLSTRPEAIADLWLDYYRRIFSYTAGTPRLVISFDALLRDPMNTVNHIARHLNIPIEADRWKKQLQVIVKPGQVRHGAQAATTFPAYLNADTVALYHYLCTTVDAGKQPAAIELERIFAGAGPAPANESPGAWARLWRRLGLFR